MLLSSFTIFLFLFQFRITNRIFDYKFCRINCTFSPNNFKNKPVWTNWAILSRWDSLAKTVYMEKNHPTYVRSHLCEVRSQLRGMNQFSYKRFVFTKRNIPFCRELTQVRRLIWLGWFFSYKQLLSSIQTYFIFLKNTKLATCIKSLQSVFSKKYFFYVTLVVPQMNLWCFFFAWWGESLISFLAKIIDVCSSSLAKPLKLITFFHAFQHLIS